MTYQGRVALITGAGSGIGRATALLLSQRGAKVALVGLSRPELESVGDEVAENGGTHLSIEADISEPTQMRDAYGRVDSEWGRLDLVFANAGINGVWAPAHELEPDEWRKTIEVNVNGTFFTIKYAVPILERQGGAVVVTSSVNGTRMFTNTGATAYSSSKAAQVAMAKMLALEFADRRIRVNVICPGAIQTDIESSTDRQDLDDAGEPVEFPEGEIPLTDGQPGTARQVAELVVFLGSDAASHITGTEVWIDGGQSLLQG